MKASQFFYVASVVFVVLYILSRRDPRATKDYSGYIIDSITRKPIAGVYVKDILSGSDTFSDSLGHFLIPFNQARPDGLLFFYKDKFANDTFSTRRLSRNVGQEPRFFRLFIEDSIDRFHHKVPPIKNN